MNPVNQIYKILKAIRRTILKKRSDLFGKYFPEFWANKNFKKRFGRDINWENPTTYNEIINCEKLQSDTSLWSVLADKYRVREYIKEKGFEDILVKLYGVWDNVDDIDFASLPNKFVLKMNNGCATVMIVKDKESLDIKTTKRKLNSWMKLKFGYSSIEPHYLRITPVIIAEELLEPEVSDLNQSISLLDYKWFCFKGYVSYVEVVSNRTKHGFNISIHDREWEKYPQFVSDRVKTDIKISKPANLSKMITICEVLSAEFPQVRVDLYEVNGKIYFGELTFSSGAGYSTTKTKEFDYLLSDIYYTQN